MENSNQVLMGLTFGDAAGIGAELVAKVLQKEEIRRLATWVLIGDEKVFQRGEAEAGVKLDYKKISTLKEIDRSRDQYYLLDLANVDTNQVEVGSMSPEAGRACGETLTYALQLALDEEIDGVVYAPLNKEALHRGGLHFHDEIHFFADLLGCQEGFSEINAMDQLWITRVTSHVPLKNVANMITHERVAATIRFAQETLCSVGYEQPRIAVAALNPHAGEGGVFGREEIEVISPAIKEAQQEGILVEGPYPADTIFLRLKKQPVDAIVGMYHDQVQTGMKMMGFNRGVTISGGLPVVLATPAHGTAFDIAGQGKADPGATVAAMKMAVRLAKSKLK